MGGQALVLATGPAGFATGAAELRFRLAGRLSQHLQAEITVIALPSYDRLLDALCEGEASAAWLPPALWIEAHAHLNAIPLVGFVRERGSGYRSGLFVRADSRYADVSELRHQRIAWVDPRSCAGYVFPRLALRASGIELEGFFREERMLGSHEAVVRAVAIGDVEAGATWMRTQGVLEFGTPRNGWDRAVGPACMKPLLISPPVPTDVIALAPSQPKAVARMMKAALRELLDEPEGKEIVRALFGAIDFVDVALDDYAQVRQLLVPIGSSTLARFESSARTSSFE